MIPLTSAARSLVFIIVLLLLGGNG